MTTFIGDYICKVDSKGRIMLPAAFKRQMPSKALEKFVVKKDIFEKCLLLFPIDEWERQNRIIRKSVNPYNRDHSRFIRGFYKGTAEIILDNNNRMLIPRRLLEFAAIKKDVVLAGQDGKIEIWTKESYEKLDEGDKDFANLAENILGGSLNNTEE